MLPRRSHEIEKNALPAVTLTADGRDVSDSRAFAAGTVLHIHAEVPRRLGVATVVMRLWRDGGECRDLAFSYINTREGEDTDEYTLTLSLTREDLPGGCDVRSDDGLFYYRFLFLRAWNTLFSSTNDQMDMTLSEREDETRPYRLLVTLPAFDTPRWLAKGTMYHVFVDRFAHGAGETSNPDGAILNPDWEGGIPQYGPYPGAPCENHEFFGGNLWGVAEKIPYLKSLGVTVLYLSPIFRAYSNHKYDTGDYETVDGMFGGDAALRNLVDCAHEAGMHVMLDGVFNHTGDHSRYFHRRGDYDSVGAYQSKTSPYAGWYTFHDFPNDYDSWWGVQTLPRLDQTNPDCRRYFTGENGIAARWCRFGVDGWRLDVADELCDEFLDEFRRAVHANTDGQGAVLGEVWENAADKVSYGQRRRYLRGAQLDSVMNYPVRTALIAFVRDGDARTLASTLTELYASYPRSVCRCLMNLLGTHDTQRILNVLGGDDEGERTNAELSTARMTVEQRELGLRRLRMASALQYTVYGIPSLFYGDEAGMEGYRDPFCRKPYPWGREDESLLAHYRLLGRMRLEHPALDGGDFRVLTVEDHFIAYERVSGNDRLVIAANRGGEDAMIHLPGRWRDLLTGEKYGGDIAVVPDSVLILKRGDR